jgi:hypothetical protein
MIGDTRRETTMGARRIRRQQRQTDMAKSRQVNGMLKTKERVRRDARMLGYVQKGKLPYLPGVMSWLSTKLNKPSKQITDADVNQLVKASKA